MGGCPAPDGNAALGKSAKQRLGSSGDSIPVGGRAGAEVRRGQRGGLSGLCPAAGFRAHSRPNKEAAAKMASLSGLRTGKSYNNNDHSFMAITNHERIGNAANTIQAVRRCFVVFLRAIIRPAPKKARAYPVSRSPALAITLVDAFRTCILGHGR